MKHKRHKKRVLPKKLTIQKLMRDQLELENHFLALQAEMHAESYMLESKRKKNFGVV